MAKKDAAAPKNKLETKGSASSSESTKASSSDGKSKSQGMLASIRPMTRRPLFFVLFALLCAWTVAMYEPCDVKGKKRDCGFAGISPMQCRTGACFTKTSGPFSKKSIKVKREKGMKLGLDLDEKGDVFVVRSIHEGGAVKSYNNGLEDDGQEERLVPGDRLVKIDSVRGRDLAKEVARSSGEAKTLTLEVQRSRLPFALQFLHSSKGKPNFLERLFSAPGFLYFTQNWLALSYVAVPSWFISGYPVGSLFTYLGMSSAVSFQLARCCHNENVPGGVPHCYAGKREQMFDISRKMLSETSEIAMRVASDPRSYFDWLFMPGKR